MARMPDMTDAITPRELCEQVALLQGEVMDCLWDTAAGQDARIIILALISSAANIAIASDMPKGDYVELVTFAAQHAGRTWPGRAPNVH